MVLAEKSGISRRTVQAIEMGHSISLDKFIGILRILDSPEERENFLLEMEISPLLLAKMKGEWRKLAFNQNEVRDEGE